MLEIKCPLDKNSVSWKDFFQKNIIPPYYWAQIQCGLFCSESKIGFFLVYFSPEEHYLEEVFLNLSFIEEMIVKGREYRTLLNHYQNQMKEKNDEKKN